MKEVLIKKLLGDDILSYDEVLKKRIVRNKVVTRFAPSPTGFIHIGAIYNAFMAYHYAHQKKGLFILRIEDTDENRYVDGAVDLINSSLEYMNIIPDESEEIGGLCDTYVQSKRGLYYRSFVAELLRKDLAYPCFMDETTINTNKEIQKQLGKKIGVYGKYAPYRNITEEEIEYKLNLMDKPKYTIRIKAQAYPSKWIDTTDDLIRGEMKIVENDMDVILLKSNLMPTYHLAHIVDDYLMGVTHVFRGDEWLPSFPLHYQIAEYLGIDLPFYGHTPAITKIDENTGNKRKISKRYDPEANIDFYLKAGYTPIAIKKYLMNLINSNFENSSSSLENYHIFLSEMNSSSPLLDMNKLDYFSREYIAELNSNELYKELLFWSSKYDRKRFRFFLDNEVYIKNILSIERDNTDRVRKDWTRLSDIFKDIYYFFKENNMDIDESIKIKDKDLIKRIILVVKGIYDETDSKEIWFNKIKNVATMFNFALKKKDLTESNNGLLSDMVTIIRFILTGTLSGPDLYEIMKVMGQNRVFERIDNWSTKF